MHMAFAHHLFSSPPSAHASSFFKPRPTTTQSHSDIGRSKTQILQPYPHPKSQSSFQFSNRVSLFWAAFERQRSSPISSNHSQKNTILQANVEDFQQEEQKDLRVGSRSYGGAPEGGNVSGKAVIKVIGVGGGGCNAVNRMVEGKVANVEFWAVNTDAQALSRALAPHKLQIGRETTLGRGAGGSSEVGQEAATESLAELSLALEGADLVFISAGMGGGTGSGAAPVITRLAKAMGALTIGFVTEPFAFEGIRRSRAAKEGVRAMKAAADTVVVVPNERLLETVGPNTSIVDAFCLADDVLRQGIQGISDIITVPGLVNVDFADVKAIMSNAGSAMLGIGIGHGKNRAEEVAHSAIMSPLLYSVNKPMGVVYNVTGGNDLTLHEVNIAAEIVCSMADPNANVIFGAVIDDSFHGTIQMTVIATSFQDPAAENVHSKDDHRSYSRTVDDDIYYWEQNQRQEWLQVPEFLRKRSRRTRKGII